MQPYREFRPTQFDAPGLAGDRHGISDWLVAPVSQTRDSGCLERSNFACTLRELGGESDTVQVHRFGHWGPGWYEIILIAPADESRVQIATEIEDGLSDYPVVDESHFSELEWQEACETWARASLRDRLHYIRDSRSNGRDTSIFCIRRDELPEDDQGTIRERLLGN